MEWNFLQDNFLKSDKAALNLSLRTIDDKFENNNNTITGAWVLQGHKVWRDSLQIFFVNNVSDIHFGLIWPLFTNFYVWFGT